MEILGSGIETTAEIVDIMTSGYNESYKKMRRKISRAADYSESKVKGGEVKKQKQTVYSALNRLKRQGLAEKKDNGWHLTRLGSEKSKFLRAKLGENNYKSKKADGIVIVIFDVPEKERWKRNWLRSVLDNMGFKLLQNSVWIGKRRIANDFLDDLKVLNIASYVEIFSVNKIGTLEKKI